jgi:hypothetical protein
MITITSPTQGQVFPIGTTQVLVQGTTTQTVNGSVLPQQTFQYTADISSVSGSISLNAKNSSGESATVTVSKLTAIEFWGVNGHIGWGAPYTNQQAQVNALVDLNMKSYRNGYSIGAFNTFKSFINTYAAPAGVAVYPVLLPDVGSVTNETDAYTLGYKLGVEVAGLKGLVQAYEICNELDSWCILGGQFNGDIASHYDNAKFQIARGAIRGIIAGIKSLDTVAKIVGVAGTWLHYGFADMLRNGTQPDGTAGHPTVDWDITSWHWYSDMGDPEKAGWINANVLQHLASYGKPIWITEYGVRGSFSGDENVRTAYLTGATCMADWYGYRTKYNIQHCAMYELFDDGRAGDEGMFGLVLNDAVTPKPIRYAAVKSFVANHQ